MKNTDIRSFDLTQRTIFGLLSQTLFGAAYTPEPDVDWTEVYRESENQAVRLQTFANHHLIPGIPDELREEIRTYQAAAMLRNARIHAGHTYVHSLLTKNGIAYTVLKGASSACFYPNPMTRAMGDVDFFVSREDFDRALELFTKEGFTVSGQDHICHAVLGKKKAHLEMHFEPAGVPDGEVGEKIRAYLSDLRECAIPLKNSLTTCMRPCDFHHGLIMLMHLQHHLLAEGIGLRHLCDWSVFVACFQQTEFRDLFEERLKSVGLWRLARLLSLSAVLYIGLPEQDWMREDPEDEMTARQLMRDIVAGGNFGKKNRQRAYEGLFISNRGKDGVGNNRLKEGFGALNRITRAKCPFTQRVPILLPVGWVAVLLGYLFRNHKRNQTKGHVSAADAYKKSSARQQLYRKLGLYEPEL
jgi:hypothetical protein